MPFIVTYEQLMANARTFDAVRRNQKHPEHRLALDLLRKGKVLLPYIVDGSLGFVPSRFAGYKDNTLAGHAVREERDGRLTNPAIERVLRERFGSSIKGEVAGNGSQIADALELVFKAICNDYSLVPDNTVRRFWPVPDAVDLLEEEGLDDPSSLRRKVTVQDVLALTGITQTMKETMIRARMGQGRFRRDCIDVHKRCAVTGIADPMFLNASHIWAWKECGTQAEHCLNPLNGLLLIPNLDRLFDRHLISFAKDGTMLVGPQLRKKIRAIAGIKPSIKITVLPGQEEYLQRHREIYEKKAKALKV